MKESSIDIIKELITRYPMLLNVENDLIQAAQDLVDCYHNGGKALICGNGGSAADSLHIVGELMKNFVIKREIPAELKNNLATLFPNDADYYIDNLQGSLPAISLVNEVALLTAYSNDNVSDLAFAQQIVGYGRKNDVLLAISTSGNSKNVIHAARVAKALEMKVVSLTGESGGALESLTDVSIQVPSKITHEIQELQLPVYHALCLALENEFFGKEVK